MDNVRETRRPWRSWTVIALVLATLALAQACGDSGHRTTGPTKTTPVALKVNRAQLPAGCTGTLIVDGPNGFHLEVAIPPSGQVTISLPIGQTVTLTASIICNAQTSSDSTTRTPGPGNNEATLTVVATTAGIACPSQIKIGDTANCTCTIQSPTTPVVTWVGATPTGAKTASFTGTVAGQHDVTCVVNGGASATTKVTVQSPTPAAPPVGSITVHNNS